MTAPSLPAWHSPWLPLIVGLGVLALERGHAAPRASWADKCTTVIVGRLATTDGSVILAHNEDWGEFEVPLRWHRRERHAAGETVTLRTGLVLEQALETYGYLLPAAGCNGINEFQVMITDNTGSCRKEMVRSETGIEMVDLVAVALQRSKSAREAVVAMGRLIERFGYRCVDGAGGDIFSVADPSEGWWMEVTTTGQWVASRVPDDAFVVIANRFRIEAVDLADSSRFLASSNLVAHAKEKGWYDPARGPFNFAQAYGGQRPESARREWRANSVLGGSALGPEESRLATVPARKLEPRDLMALLRDHYEGVSEGAAAAGAGAGAGGSPHRGSERPICAHYTDASTVAHLRGWLPPGVGGLVWLAIGTPCSSTYSPVYIGTEEFPRPYAAVTEKYDPENAYWVFNALENLVDRNYRERGASLGGGTRKDGDSAIEFVAGHWKRREAEAFATQSAVEKVAVELAKEDPARARSFLSGYTRWMAQRNFDDARSLADELRTRHER